MKANPKALYFTGVYLLLTGMILLSQVAYPRIDRAIKRHLYDTVSARVAELRNFRAQQDFLVQVEADLFYEHRGDLLKAMQAFKRDQVDRVPLAAILTAVAGTLAGLGYMAMAVALLRRASLSGKFVVAGFCLSVVYLAVFMANAFAEITFLDYTSVELWQMASFLKPHLRHLTYTPLVKSLFNFSVTRTVVFAVGWVVFYLIVPLYGLLRPQVMQIWKRSH